MPRALVWTTALRIVTRGLAFATTLIVARLIAPSEYGVFAAILIGAQLIGSITDLSMFQAIIQMRRDPLPYVNTAWTVDVIRGVAVAALIFVVAPWWAALLQVPQATDLLRVLGLSQVIVGLHNTGTYLLRRNLDFGHLFILHASEAATYTLVVIAGGVLLHNAWALVFAVLASYATRVIAGYLVTRVRPRFGLDRDKFREMFAFSKWTTAFSVVDFALEAGDNTVVGSVLGPTNLAFYRMGYQVSTEGSSALQLVLTPVAFPAMSRVQLDLERVRAGFRAMLGLSVLAVLPLTGALIMLAPLGVPLLLGERWTPAVGPLRILAAAALVRGILEMARPVLLGLGRSREDFGLKLLQVVVMLALAYPAAMSGGMLGVAWAVLAGAIATLPAWAYLLTRYAHVGWADFLRPVIAPAIASATAVAGLLVVIRTDGGWIELLAYGALYAVLFAVSSLVLMRVMPDSGLALVRRPVR